MAQHLLVARYHAAQGSSVRPRALHLRVLDVCLVGPHIRRWLRRDDRAGGRCVLGRHRRGPGTGAGAAMCESAAVELPRADVDPGGLLEYSVVFTDRSLNHMSKRFVGVMQDIVEVLRTTYGAETVAVVPGGGTFAMEAVARQLATGRRCLVIRNGLFSYRWSQIFDAGSIPSSSTVCQARPVSDEHQAAWVPAPVDEVVAAIGSSRPEVVFAAHVETAAGMLLPDDYVSTV